jgi:hypothetical protein
MAYGYIRLRMVIFWVMGILTESALNYGNLIVDAFREAPFFDAYLKFHMNLNCLDAVLVSHGTVL